MLAGTTLTASLKLSVTVWVVATTAGIGRRAARQHRRGGVDGGKRRGEIRRHVVGRVVAVLVGDLGRGDGDRAHFAIGEIGSGSRVKLAGPPPGAKRGGCRWWRS